MTWPGLQLGRIFGHYGIVLKHGLDSVRAGVAAEFAIQDCLSDRPADVAQPSQSRMAKQVQVSPAVGRHGPPAGDVNLSPLAVEFGLGHIPRVVQPRGISEDFAEHRGDKSHRNTANCTGRCVRAPAVGT